MKILLSISFAILLGLHAIAFGAASLDGDGEWNLHSRSDYEGVKSKPWLKDMSLTPKDRLYREFLYTSAGFLADHLRWPDPESAAAILEASKIRVLNKAEDLKLPKNPADLGLSPDDVEFMTAKIQAAVAELNSITPASIMNGHERPMDDFMRWFTNRYLYLRRKLASNFIRAIRQSDLKKGYRTVPSTPNETLLWYAAIKSKVNGGPTLLLDYTQGKLTPEMFKELYTPGFSTGLNNPIYPQPLLFPNGWSEMEAAAEFDAPFAFNNYQNTREIVTMERAKATIAAVEKAKAFIAISWTSGKTISPDWLESLIRYAEVRDIPILVGPTQQNYDGLPEIFLTHPRIHVVTHTIENSALKISNQPINPDTEDPLQKLKKVGAYKPGQTVMVFHPHQRLEIASTTYNDTAPVLLISTGSINAPTPAPYASMTLGGRKTDNVGFWKEKAFIFEKADAVSNLDPDGVQNIWHPRPINYYDDRQYNGTAGFIDLGKAYQFRYGRDGSRTFEIVNARVSHEYNGDIHDGASDPGAISAVINDLPRDPETDATMLSGDSMDFGDTSHHLDGRDVDMALKFEATGMSFQKQINSGIQLANGILSRFHKARMGFIVGNHEEWLSRELNRPRDLNKLISGGLLDELGFVWKTIGMNIWEYIFKNRQVVLGALLTQFPEKRSKIIKRLATVDHPDRIDILDRVRLFAGPPHRLNSLADHGDKGVYGKRNVTLKDQARAMPEGGGVTAHRHTVEIYAENMDPGALAYVNPSYAKGFHSRTGQGVVWIYENGTKQLLIYNRVAGTFLQRPGYPVLPAAKFFGDSPLKALPNPNDSVDKTPDLQRVQKELDCIRQLTGNADSEDEGENQD